MALGVLHLADFSNPRSTPSHSPDTNLRTSPSDRTIDACLGGPLHFLNRLRPALLNWKIWGRAVGSSEFSTRPWSSYAKALLSGGIIILVVAAFFIYYEVRFTEVKSGVALTQGRLTEAQGKSIDIAVDTSKLFITWAISLIGATGFFLKINLEREVKVRKIDLVMAFLIILLCVFSLFFGQVVLDFISRALSQNQDPFNSDNNDIVRGNLKGQYLSGLAAVFLFGLHLVQFFWARISP